MKAISSCSPVRKHPRLRGEDYRRPVAHRSPLETPPLTRGRRRRTCWRSKRLRNTPAYAGKTRILCFFVPEHQKHPRLRGEDWLSPLSFIQFRETPPLTRGRLDDIKTYPRPWGNTPAYAGKTRRMTWRDSRSWKHPRLRGEDDLIASGVKPLMETPPLTRGRQQHFVQRQVSQYKIRYY